LATATVIGLILMPLGPALEHDRRLRGTYPAVAAAAGFVLWSTHQAAAVAVAVAVAAVWVATYRRGRWIVVGAAVAAGLVALSPLRRYFPLAWHDAGLTAGPTLARRRQLVEAGMALLRETWFLGGGPGSFARRAGPALAASADASGLGPPPWSPYSPLVEIASQYGLAAAVLVVMTGLGLLMWCVVRLVHTSGRPWSSPERAPAVWLGCLVVALPFVGLIQPSWFNDSLVCLVVGTVALLARHTEEPQGRRATVAQAALSELEDRRLKIEDPSAEDA
jgi:hypothetical protein